MYIDKEYNYFSTNWTIYKIGFWSGIIAFVSTVAFVIVQVLQLLGMLQYPWDEISIYGFSLFIVLPLMIEMLAFHYILPSKKKFWSNAALIFTVLYVAFVSANYIVQLTTVIPMTLQGTDENIELLKQTPHSLFWDFDAIGYIYMGLATLFAIPVFEKYGFQKWVRYSFIFHTLVTPLIIFVYFYPNFSNTILLVGLPWGISAPVFMLLLAIWLKKIYNKKTIEYP
jgi:hypothetical protein